MEPEAVEFEVLLRKVGSEVTNLLGTVNITVTAHPPLNEEMVAAGAREALKVDPDQVADMLIATAAKIRRDRR